jgi:hypothetical protein
MSQQREQDAPRAAEDTKPRRIDLSVAQVAASALAAVVGAVLASELGVYGTIAGAAVVSIGATTGGAVFQHLFRRTGEQLRSAIEATGEPDRPEPRPAAELTSDWNEPQLVRARRRWTWKTYAAASGMVFVLAMAPIVVVELVAGKPMHDITTGSGGSGTSFNPGSTGRSPGSAPEAPPAGGGSTDPAHVPSTSASGTPSTPSSAAPSAGPSPSATPSGSPSPSPSGSPSASASPTPTPSGSVAPVTPSGSPSP